MPQGVLFVSDEMLCWPKEEGEISYQNGPSERGSHMDNMSASAWNDELAISMEVSSGDVWEMSKI